MGTLQRKSVFRQKKTRDDRAAFVNLVMMTSPKIITGRIIPACVEKWLALTALASGIFALSDVSSHAAAVVTSLSLKFGADETNGALGTSQVDGPAGLFNVGNWNNETLLNGSASNLVLDLNGAVVASSAAVTWNSNNTWSSTGRGEENNFAMGEDRDLMAGYLDTGGLGGVGVTINMTGLPATLTQFGYDVYVYSQGGVNGRGGTYTMNAGTTSLSAFHEVTAGFDGTYLEDTDPAMTPGAEIFGSNYLVFRNLTTNAFDLTTTPQTGGTPRAPINAIEIVAHVPEPGSVALIGATGLLALMRRRRHPD
jgi:hypothetical protein